MPEWAGAWRLYAVNPRAVGCAALANVPAIKRLHLTAAAVVFGQVANSFCGRRK